MEKKKKSRFKDIKEDIVEFLVELVIIEFLLDLFLGDD